MLGKRKARQENLFGPVKRETRVSKELRSVREILDFGWFREEVKDKFCLENGRPSIAPETLAAIIFLGYWSNITSDRMLCEECEDRLSFREFIGLSDEDEVPVHSSLTNWRQRIGREVFQRFLQHTAELAKERGLKPGRCRLFDASMVKAQADAGGASSVNVDPTRDTNDYLDALGEWEQPVSDEEDTGGGRNGSGVGQSQRMEYRKRKLDSGSLTRVNTHDVDAKFISRKGKKPDFYHKVHFEFDCSSGLIMNADAGHVSDAAKMVEFLADEIEPVDTVGGDTGYFTVESQLWLKAKGLESLISVRDNASSRGVVFGLEAFSYVAIRDEYVCPNGVSLTRQNKNGCKEKRYATPRGSCIGCENAMFCFRDGKCSDRRQLGLSADRSVVEEAKLRNRSNRYWRIMRKRSILCEGGIGTMKTYGGLGKARALGEEAAAIQAAMSGVVHNVKKIMKHTLQHEKAALVTTYRAIGQPFERLARLAARITSPHLSILQRMSWTVVGARSRRLEPESVGF